MFVVLCFDVFLCTFDVSVRSGGRGGRMWHKEKTLFILYFFFLSIFQREHAFDVFLFLCFDVFVYTMCFDVFVCTGRSGRMWHKENTLLIASRHAHALKSLQALQTPHLARVNVMMTTVASSLMRRPWDCLRKKRMM